MNYNDTIFVTDMDGTLLSKNKTVSERNLKLIREYQAQGGLFGVATGRPIHTTTRYLDILKPDLPLILYNGCIVYDYKSEKSFMQHTCLTVQGISLKIFSRNTLA